MRIFYLVLILMFFTLAPSFARDVVYSGGETYEGKISSLSGGLIQFKRGGVQHSVNRTRGPEYFGDYIKYRTSPLGERTLEVSCRVEFVDFFTIIFQTPDARVQIPRYRVTSLVVNAD